MNYLDIAQQWLVGNYDEETKSEVKRLMNEDKKTLEDSFYKNLEFGTGGMRGIMGVGTNRMNKYTIGMATQGLANYILKNIKTGNPSVCISFDSRNNSKYFAQIAADVLSANGIKVYLFDGIRPTPELSYTIRRQHSVAGIMITASHNPKQYNGYKVFGQDGGQVTSPVDKEIVNEVNNITNPDMVKFNGDKSKIEIIGKEVDEDYMRDILSLVPNQDKCKEAKNLKIVYTPLHGCGVYLVPECLRRLGFSNIYTVKEQEVSDGNFPTVKSPNPEEESAMKMALNLAQEVNADIVMATDPDSDRLGIAIRDKKGNIIRLNGNQTAAIITYYLLNDMAAKNTLCKEKDYVIKTIVTSELIRRIAESFGVKCYNVLTGFKYIAEIVKQNEGKGRFICGGEESYGFNAGEYVRDKDAQLTACLVASCTADALSKGKSLYDVLEEIYSKYGYCKESLEYLVREGKDGAKEIEDIMHNLRTNTPKELAGKKVVKVIDYLDTKATGLPKSNVLQFFNEDDDVVSVRPSGTEPKIKFYFGAVGANAEEKIEKLKKDFSI